MDIAHAIRSFRPVYTRESGKLHAPERVEFSAASRRFSTTGRAEARPSQCALDGEGRASARPQWKCLAGLCTAATPFLNPLWPLDNHASGKIGFGHEETPPDHPGTAMKTWIFGQIHQRLRGPLVGRRHLDHRRLRRHLPGHGLRTLPRRGDGPSGRRPGGHPDRHPQRRLRRTLLPASQGARVPPPLAPIAARNFRATRAG